MASYYNDDAELAYRVHPSNIKSKEYVRDFLKKDTCDDNGDDAD